MNARPLYTYQARQAMACLSILGAPPADLVNALLPRVSNLRSAGEVDLDDVELRVEGLFHADENPGGAL